MVSATVASGPTGHKKGHRQAVHHKICITKTIILTLSPNFHFDFNFSSIPINVIVFKFKFDSDEHHKVPNPSTTVLSYDVIAITYNSIYIQCNIQHSQIRSKNSILCLAFELRSTVFQMTVRLKLYLLTVPSTLHYLFKIWFLHFSFIPCLKSESTPA